MARRRYDAEGNLIEGDEAPRARRRFDAQGNEIAAAPSRTPAPRRRPSTLGFEINPMEPIFRPMFGPVLDPTNRRRVGENISRAVRGEYRRLLETGRARAARGDPLAVREIAGTFQRAPGETAQALRQVPPALERVAAAGRLATQEAVQRQTGDPLRRPNRYGPAVSSVPTWSQERPERIPAQEDDVGAEDVSSEIAAALARGTPGVAADLAREYTFGPGADVRDLTEFRAERMAAGAPQAEIDELTDEILRRSGAHTLNVALAPFDAAALTKAGVSAARQLPRLRGPGARPRVRQPSAAQARAAAALQEWEAGRPVRRLEREFGDLTAGERAGDPYAMSREQELRRGGAAQETMQGFDEARSEQMQEKLMSGIATRGLEPQNPDIASAGNTLVDELRTQHDALREVQAGWYDEAMRLGADDPIAPTDELLDTVLAGSREHFGNLDGEAIGIIRELHSEIATGQATYARIERARQALNAELRDAMRRPDGGRQVDAIHRVIDDLDAFAAPRVSPETRQAILEARAITKEIGDMYGQQLRPELATGHVGRRDLGGQTLRQLRETDIADEAVMNRVFGAGAKPSATTFSTVRRVAENARRQLATEGMAPTGAATGQSQRLTGRRALEGRRTKGERTFDPTPAERAKFGTELPRADLQALREAWVYRLTKPLEAGSPVPFGELATRLRHALSSSRSTTEQLYNAREIATLERALEYMERATLPKGAYMPSAPGIAEAAVQRGLVATVGRLLGSIHGFEGVGEAIRRGIVNARQMREARAAVARPVVPRLAAKGRLQRIRGASRRSQPAAPAGPAIAATPPAAQIAAPTQRPSSLRGPSGKISPAALIALGAGGSALVAPPDAQAQEQSPELAEVRARIQQTQERYDTFNRALESGDQNAIKAMQRLMRVDDDGVIGWRTREAADREFAELGAELERLRGQEAFLTTRPNETQKFWRGPGGIVAPLAGGMALGFLTRYGIATIPAMRRNMLLTRRNLRALPQMPPRANVATRARIDRQRRTIATEAERRASRVNDFWRLGGAGERTPFRTSQRGFSARPQKQVADPSSLYPPSTSPSRYIPDAAIVSVGAGDAVTMHFLLQDAHREVEAARDALEQPGGKSAANYQRLEAALDRVTTLESWQRAGIGLASGHLAAMKLIGRARPNVDLAERERFRLNRYLRERGGGKP